MPDHSFSQFVYFDTNILSIVAQESSLWAPIRDSYMAEDLTIALGPGQASELSDAKHLHDDLVRFLISVPSAIIRNPDEIIDEEVASFPNPRTQSLLAYPLNALLLKDGGIEEFKEFISSEQLSEARDSQKVHSKQMAFRHEALKDNFPPAKSGKYETSQADEFAALMTVQWLAGTHPTFLKQNIQEYLASFKSIRMYALVIFYKYYIGRRKPKRTSDFGDLFHTFALPYCNVVVMERDLSETLRQIQRNHQVIADVDIENVEYLDKFRSVD